MFNRSDFDKEYRKTEKIINFTFWLILTITLAMLAGGVFVVYKVLAFIGIL